MKKFFSIALLIILFLSACSVNVGLDGETGVDVDILPGDPTPSGDGDQGQDAPDSNFWSNPFFIAFIVALLIIVLVVVLRRPNRPQ